MTEKPDKNSAAIITGLIRYLEALDGAIEAGRKGQLPCNHGLCALESARITLFECLQKSGVTVECHQIHGTIQ